MRDRARRLQECTEHLEEADAGHQAAAVLGIGLIACGEDRGVSRAAGRPGGRAGGYPRGS